MKITLNWLKDYVDFNGSPEELSERLTMLGLEVEGVQKLGGEFDNVVVAQILSFEKHPNADKLSVCKVADGQGERQIVCGAKNFKAGDKVPLALPGCTLPTPAGAPPFTIKVGKIRNVESFGMMCSAKELGLAEDAEGLLILPADARVGQPFAEHLGRAGSDVIYDLEVTPNRPDLNSVLGIAREISALTGNPLRVPNPDWKKESELPEEASNAVAVDLRDPDLCPRYTARVIRGVKVGPSPAWLKDRLEKAGIRSISNVVDVTNYVMLEIGQPLHAFDFRLLSNKSGQPVIRVRRAAEAEIFVTLDGQKRQLTPENLLIADEEKGIALAGVMGGQNSEIQDSTSDVLIESAYFSPTNIRRTSKRLDLKTDSSYRFERGADPNICDWASRRAVQLILEMAGGKVARGVVDAYPAPHKPKTVSLRPEKTGQLLGIEIAREQQVRYLESLGIRKIGAENGSVSFEIPSFRVDIKREVDLIEEVGRLHGVEKIPSSKPRGAFGSHPFDAVHDQLMEIRRVLTGLGLSEAQGQTLISRGAPGQAAATAVALENPLSSDMDVLRASLIPGLLDSLKHNLHHKNETVLLFEIGKVFSLQGTAAREERRLGLLMTGRRQAPSWNTQDARLDVYDLKGCIEELFSILGIRGTAWNRTQAPTGIYVESAAIALGKQSLGEIGQLSPIVGKQFDVRDPVFLAELNLDLLLQRSNPSRSFKPLPQFPAIRRDIAMLVAESVTHEQVVQAVKQARPAFLESVEIFDLFRGQNVPAGQKSVAYALIYRNPEKTLTDGEVNLTHQKVIDQLKASLNASIR